MGGRRRFGWPWAAIGRGAWFAVALVLLVYFAANIPAFFRLAHTACMSENASNCLTGQLTRAYVLGLEAIHIPPSVGEALGAGLTFAVSALFWGFGFLVFWRTGRQWIGYLTSLISIMLGAIGLFAIAPNSALPAPFYVLSYAVYIALPPSFVLFMFIFPNGRFAPRWTIGLFAAAAIAMVLSSVPPNALSNVINGLGLTGLAFISPILVQVYRYLRVYDVVERQQTKWFVFGMVIFLVLVLASGVATVLGPVSVWNQVFNGPMWLLIWTILLLSVTIPILRYRIWDIDLLINRTLVYGTVTATLVGTYIGLILLLQAAVRLVSGDLSQQPLVIAISTLTIAALIQPVRRYLQTAIDHRFYRSRYDAAKVVAAFGAALPREVDLDDLRGHLMDVVHETVQPRFVSLWLRPNESGGSSPAESSPPLPTGAEAVS